MKHFIKVLLAIVLILSLSVTAYAGGVEDGDITVEDTIQTWIDEGYPVVSNVYDSSDVYFARLSTDQMGNYVSVFVQGYNINMDTVKPVFYDSEGNVISGEVAAVETITSGYFKGAFFRIEKLESDEWNIENTGSVNSKNLTVKLEAVSDKEVKYESEPFSEKVEIFRRDVYYTAYDNIRETFTVYFSTDVAADTSVMPTLVLGYHNYDEETGTYPMFSVKEATAFEMTKETNKFTGQQETKAVFSLEGFDYENSFDYWTPQFSVAFKNSVTGQEEIYDIYEDSDITQITGRVQLFQQSDEKAVVSGDADVILYYPYWIGGIYQFADTGSGSTYFITEDEAEYLGNERFAYAEYSKGSGSLTNSNFSTREYTFAYFVSKSVEKPQGIPTVTVRHDGDDIVLSWNEIPGAVGYNIQLVSEYGWADIADLQDLTFTITKDMQAELTEMFGPFQVKICAYAEVDGIIVEGDWSDAISLEETVAAPSLNITKKSLAAGKTLNLSVANANGQKVTYKSNKTSVATVNQKGKVTALSKGTAKITATVGGETLTCTIKVKTTPQIKYNKKAVKNNQTISVKKGNTVKLTITGKADGINNKVTTSKKAVAKITSKAKNDYVTIKAAKKGTSTIEVKINNAVTYSFKVKVK